MKYLLTIVFVILSLATINSQEDMSSTKISILTADSGDELDSTFGHTAIRVNNVERDIDQIFNYGVFDFDTENFYLKFMRGLLPYKLGVGSYERFLQTYHFQQRTIWEQELDLDNEQKKYFIDFLMENLKPENVEYPYDFFYDNCSTRVGDILADLPGEIAYANNMKDRTFRDMLKENLKSMAWTEFGIDLIIGANADIKTTQKNQTFLPTYLHDQINGMKVNNKPLVSKDYLVLDFVDVGERRRTKATNYPLILFGCLFLLRLLLFIMSPKGLFTRVFDKVMLVLISISSLIMLFMWFGTAHKATNNNWNLVWASPLFLGWYWLKDNKIYLYILLALLVVAALNVVVQFLPQFYHLAFLPIIGMMGLVVMRQLRNSK